MENQGYIHLYTGNGKGKTTAALGLTLRAIGAGKKVLFVQFVKQGNFSEIKALKVFQTSITVRQFGFGRAEMRNDQKKTHKVVLDAMQWIDSELSNNFYDMVILDEVVIAMHKGFLTINELFSIIENKHKEMEWILTGRYASDELIEKVDLCSEINEVKHYFSSGVAAREGIEM